MKPGVIQCGKYNLPGGGFMELGQRLRQARLEAGLSQRQLCGDVITRNMLSQIENGSARPSMETLRYLAGALEKPMGYFLEEEAVTSPNYQVMEHLRLAFAREDYGRALSHLEEYRKPDGVFDWEMYYISTLTCMALAEKAIKEERLGYAQNLLLRAEEAAGQTPYYTKEMERRRLSLLFLARPDKGCEIGKLLPPDPERTLLLAAANPERAGVILDSDPQDSQMWHFLRAEAYFVQKEYDAALRHYKKSRETDAVFEKMEACCRELEDYKGAYFYACKRREK